MTAGPMLAYCDFWTRIRPAATCAPLSVRSVKRTVDVQNWTRHACEPIVMMWAVGGKATLANSEPPWMPKFWNPSGTTMGCDKL